MRQTLDVLQQLHSVLEARKKSWGAGEEKDSYVVGLFQSGIDTMLKKIGEESVEFVLAAKENDRAALIHEAADLWFHSLVALSYRNVSYEDVLAELQRRAKS